MIKTIKNLERGLTEEQVRNARLKSLEECTLDGAVDKGMDYVADLMNIYKNNLREEYGES